MFKGWKAVVLFCQSVFIWVDQEGEVSCFNVSQWGENKKNLLLKAVLNNINDVQLIVSFCEEDLKTNVGLTVWFFSKPKGEGMEKAILGKK